MELTDVIDRISTMYRAELDMKGDILLSILEIDKELEAARNNNWETMSYARWAELNNKRDSLEGDKNYRIIRAQAMSDIREMFFSILEED